jgi:hypothetical protein
VFCPCPVQVFVDSNTPDILVQLGQNGKRNTIDPNLYGDRYAKDVERGTDLEQAMLQATRKELAQKTQEARYFRGQAAKSRRQSGQSEMEIREQERAEESMYPTT